MPQLSELAGNPAAQLPVGTKVRDGDIRVAICLSPRKVLEEELHGLSFLTTGVCSDLPLVLSVLGCAAAWILHIAPWVLLGLFFFIYLRKQSQYTPAAVSKQNPFRLDAKPEKQFLCDWGNVYPVPELFMDFLYIDNTSSCYYSCINSDMEMDKTFWFEEKLCCKYCWNKALWKMHGATSHIGTTMYS